MKASTGNHQPQAPGEVPAIASPHSVGSHVVGNPSLVHLLLAGDGRLVTQKKQTPPTHTFIQSLAEEVNP